MEKITAGLRGVLRLIFFVLFISAFLLLSFVCHWIYKDHNKRLTVFSRNTTAFIRFLTWVCNMHLTVINKPPEDQVCLVVSNHMGFVDILLMASIHPMLFVTSTEMRETPFLGLLTEMGGCIYVERRSRIKILEEMHTIVNTLKSGHRVVLYPESTSTNGEQVLPFKKTLLMAAAHANVPLQPAVINFREVNGEPFSIKWRDHLCWYGDITFHSSMWKALTLKSLKAEIEFLEPIMIKQDDDRSEIALRAHRMISQKFAAVKPMLKPELKELP